MTKFEIWYPCKNYWVYQKFGENNVCYNPETKKVIGKVNSVCPVGSVSLYQYVGMKAHNGEDLMARDGQKVYCSQDGIVVEIQTEPERGLGIGIITDKKYDLGEYGEHYVKCRYWHLKGFNCKLGDVVKVGQVIGYADNTGYSSGTHLHFECKAVEYNPDGSYYNVFQDNGFFGAFDPQPYWNKIYSQDIWIFYKLVELLKLIINFLKLKK